MLELIQGNLALILAVLFGISEALALIPALKSNSVFQLVFNILKSLVSPDKPQIK